MRSRSDESSVWQRIHVTESLGDVIVRIPRQSFFSSRPAVLLAVSGLFFFLPGVGIPIAVVIHAVVHRPPDLMWGLIGGLLPSVVFVPLAIHLFWESRDIVGTDTTLDVRPGELVLHRASRDGKTASSVVTTSRFLGTVVSYQLAPWISWELGLLEGNALEPRRPGVPGRLPDQNEVGAIERILVVATGCSESEVRMLASRIHEALDGEVPVPQER